MPPCKNQNQLKKRARYANRFYRWKHLFGREINQMGDTHSANPAIMHASSNGGWITWITHAKKIVCGAKEILRVVVLRVGATSKQIGSEIRPIHQPRQVARPALTANKKNPAPNFTERPQPKMDLAISARHALQNLSLIGELIIQNWLKLEIGNRGLNIAPSIRTTTGDGLTKTEKSVTPIGANSTQKKCERTSLINGRTRFVARFAWRCLGFVSLPPRKHLSDALLKNYASIWNPFGNRACRGPITAKTKKIAGRLTISFLCLRSILSTVLSNWSASISRIFNHCGESLIAKSQTSSTGNQNKFSVQLVRSCGVLLLGWQHAVLFL